MSQIDSTLMGSLAASLMGPQAAQRQGGIANPYMDILRRRNAQSQSARPGPRGQGTPMAQHVEMHNPGGFGGATKAIYGSQAGPWLTNNGTGGGAGNEGPSAVNLEHEGGEGGSVTLTPQSAQPARTLQPEEKGAPTWRDQMKLDEGQLGSLNQQYDHIASQLQREFDPAKQAPLQAQLDAIHGQRTSLTNKLYSPGALDEYQAAGRNRVAENELSQISPTIHQPVQIQPGELGPTGRPYQSLEGEANRAAAGIQQPVQIQPGQPGPTGRPYQPANVAAQKQSDLHAHLQSMGVPKAPQQGALLDANQAAAIKQAAGGNPDAAAQLALSLGYNIKQMKPAEQQTPAAPKRSAWSGAMSGQDMQQE